MIKNNLQAGLKIDSKELEKIFIETKIDPHLRPERLNLSDFKILFAALKSFMV